MKKYSDPMMKLVSFEITDNTNAFETRDDSGIDFGDLQTDQPGTIVANSDPGSGSITTTWLA